MEWLHYIIAALFVLIGFVCMLSVAINLPGTWIMIGLAVVIEFLDGLYRSAPEGQEPVTFGWMAIAVCTGFALFGELIEFLAGAFGVKYGGGTNRGMAGAIIGGFIGAIVITILLPIPLIGTLVGALIGTFAGAVIAEVSGKQPMTVHGSMRPAIGATVGRTLGTVGKVCVAFVIWIVLSFSAFWPM